MRKDKELLIKYYEKLCELKNILYLNDIKDVSVQKIIILKYPEYIPYLYDKKLLYKKLNDIIDYYTNLVVFYFKKLDKDYTKEELIHNIDKLLKYKDYNCYIKNK